MIQIKEYPEETVDLYSPNDEYIETLNQAQFLDVRIQIVEQAIEGYYIVTPYGKHGLNTDGTIENPTERLFEKTVNLARALNGLVSWGYKPKFIIE